MNLESLDPEQVESALLGLGALSVTFTDAGDEPVLEPKPGELRLWPNTRVLGLFQADADIDRVSAALAGALAAMVADWATEATLIPLMACAVVTLPPSDNRPVSIAARVAAPSANATTS